MWCPCLMLTPGGAEVDHNAQSQAQRVTCRFPEELRTQQLLQLKIAGSFKTLSSNRTKHPPNRFLREEFKGGVKRFSFTNRQGLRQPAIIQIETRPFATTEASEDRLDYRTQHYCVELSNSSLKKSRDLSHSIAFEPDTGKPQQQDAVVTPNSRLTTLGSLSGLPSPGKGEQIRIIHGQTLRDRHRGE
ncbi:hypothetical protein CIHG_07685 [Coccidioides immitis H538.4]|uniref:Uncharacterized protein n=3 Tax=Coccidioides immitis TaxID=5501 RepID=A0A0J8QT62_COCIT|nr:hypothetical protein CIRG_04162 [Coccidioides immitis RMSCC 2394]KMU76059.1 hypothetical protein CISG_05318 [Coccidioides immitis RMSCC 3703]KMU90002.1 hypothetical protein CIHG_07685 [Coccidioides immitis H538.4]